MGKGRSDPKKSPSMSLADFQTILAGIMKAYTMAYSQILPVFHQAQQEAVKTLSHLDPTARLVLAGSVILLLILFSFRTARYIFGLFLSLLLLSIQIALVAVSIGVLYLHKDSLLAAALRPFCTH